MSIVRKKQIPFLTYTLILVIVAMLFWILSDSILETIPLYTLLI